MNNTSASSTEKKTRHLIELDLLRGIAILLVFLFHAEQVLYPNEPSNYNTYNFLHINSIKDFVINCSPTTYGFIGVQLFLVISGFVIHYNYLKRAQPFNFKSFVSKRFWRIYPPYILVLLFFCIAGNNIQYYFTTSIGLKVLASHFFLIHNFSNKSFFSINGALWSLALEFQLYLLYPLFLFLRKKIGVQKTLLLIAGIGLIIQVSQVIFPDLSTNEVYQKSPAAFWYIWIAGALLAEYYINQVRIFKKNKILLFATFLLLIFCKFNYYTYSFIFFIATFFWMLVIEYLFWDFKSNYNSVAARIIVFIGLCSYSLYLIHQPYLFNLLNSINIVDAHSSFRFLNVLFPFLILLLISYSLYLVVELRSVRAGKFFIDKFLTKPRKIQIKS